MPNAQTPRSGGRGPFVFGPAHPRLRPLLLCACLCCLPAGLAVSSRWLALVYAQIPSALTAPPLQISPPPEPRGTASLFLNSNSACLRCHVGNLTADRNADDGPVQEAGLAPQPSSPLDQAGRPALLRADLPTSPHPFVHPAPLVPSPATPWRSATLKSPHHPHPLGATASTDWWLPDPTATAQDRADAPRCSGCHSVEYSAEMKPASSGPAACARCHQGNAPLASGRLHPAAPAPHVIPISTVPLASAVTLARCASSCHSPMTPQHVD